MGLDFWKNYKPPPKYPSGQSKKRHRSGESLEVRWLLKFHPNSKRAKKILARRARKRRQRKKDALIRSGAPWWATLTKAERKESKRNWAIKYPEKVAAHLAVAEAVRTGRLVRPKKCEGCGGTGRIEGHHADYSEPLVVIWYCQPCHRAEHEILGFLSTYSVYE